MRFAARIWNAFNSSCIQFVFEPTMNNVARSESSWVERIAMMMIWIAKKGKNQYKIVANASSVWSRENRCLTCCLFVHRMHVPRALLDIDELWCLDFNFASSKEKNEYWIWCDWLGDIYLSIYEPYGQCKKDHTRLWFHHKAAKYADKI